MSNFIYHSVSTSAEVFPLGENMIGSAMRKSGKSTSLGNHILNMSINRHLMCSGKHLKQAKLPLPDRDVVNRHRLGEEAETAPSLSFQNNF